MKITLPQQSLRILREILSAPGWAKTTKELYLGGRLLAQTLPEPDISWLKTAKQVEALTQEEVTAYQAKDKEWANTEIEIEITDAERDICRKAIEKLTEAGSIAASKYGFKVIEVFGFKPE